MGYTGRVAGGRLWNENDVNTVLMCEILEQIIIKLSSKNQMIHPGPSSMTKYMPRINKALNLIPNNTKGGGDDTNILI